MVIGFVNAGIMSLTQAATIVYGANIGTTITGQIVALGMFGGDTIRVTLEAANDMAGIFIDRFGKDVRIRADQDGKRFTVRVNVNAKKPFFGWLFGFGDQAEILAPQEVREEYQQMLRDVLKLHED